MEIRLFLIQRKLVIRIGGKIVTAKHISKYEGVGVITTFFNKIFLNMVGPYIWWDEVIHAMLK